MPHLGIRYPKNLFAQIATGLAVLFLATVYLAWLSLNDSHEHYEEFAAVSVSNIAKLIEKDILATVNTADRVVLTIRAEYLARRRSGKVPDFSMNEFIEMHRSWRPEFLTMRIYNAQRGLIQGTGSSPDRKMNRSYRDYFGRIASQPNDELLITEPLKGSSGNWVLVFARQIRDKESSFTGAVTASVPLSEFTNAFSKLSVHPHDTLVLVDQNAQLIVRIPEPDNVKSAMGRKLKSTAINRLLSSHQKTGIYHNKSSIDGVERIHAFRAIGDTQFSIVVGLAKEDYLAEWHNEVVKTIVLLTALLLVMVVMLAVVYRALKAQSQALNSLGQANVNLQREQQLNATIVQSSPFAIFTRDRHEIVTTWNAAAEKLFGWRADEVIGKSIFTAPLEQRPGYEELRAQVLSGETVVEKEVQRQKRDGALFDMSATLAPLRDADGRIDGYLAIATDITERKAAEERIEFLAYRDVLTGLPNRLLLQDRFIQAMAHAERSGQKVALLFLDLDNFKTINDSLGHAAGDMLLRQVADRLQDCVRESDTIGRQGGDEFLIVLPDIRGADAITPLLLKIRDSLQVLYEIGGNELSTSVSIGVAISPDDGRDFDTLLKKADTAMYRAKDAGRNAYRFFDEQMNVEAVEHLQLKNGLRRAVERGEFVLHYQPQIDMVSGAVVGVEALIRWNHPEHGLLAPARFIALAEDSGLIVPIGDWVIHEACRQAVAWRQSGLPPLVVAVNLSAVQFKRGDVEQTVTQALQATGFDPHYLELELTESVLIHNTDQVLATVKRLKKLGVTLSIDDFGTGYSSLSYLKRFDVDKLKIDRSFIRDLTTDPDDAAIINAIVQMARSLNLKTVAEGVETAEMLDRLKQFHCDQAQGYFFAKPMPAAEFTGYLVQCHTQLGTAI